MIANTHCNTQNKDKHCISVTAFHLNTISTVNFHVLLYYKSLKRHQKAIYFKK